MFCGECGTETTDQASFCPVCGNDLRTPRTRTSVEIAVTGELRRAGFWRRFAAYSIDVMIVWFAPIFIWSHFGFNFVIPMIAILAYPVVGTTVWGRTLGKAALGIRVVGPDGTPPGIGRTIVRETVGKFLSSIFWIGFLMAAGKQKRALHDRISGTKVEISPTNWRKRGNLNQRMHDDL